MLEVYLIYDKQTSGCLLYRIRTGVLLLLAEETTDRSHRHTQNDVAFEQLQWIWYSNSRTQQQEEEE